MDSNMERTRAAQVASTSQMIVGLRKHYPTGSTTLQIGGVTYTVDSLVAFLQQLVDQSTAVDAARAALNTKLQSEEATAASGDPVLRSLKSYILGTFGSAPTSLADFGLTPPKAHTPLTAAQKAVAAAKRKATRAARGTLGKVQKKDIKGAITATLVVTPATSSPPAASPPVAPAAPAAPTAPVTVAAPAAPAASAAPVTHA
jgi:hypothetical protein